MTLHHNFKKWRGMTLRFLIDNSWTVKYINKQRELTHKR